MRCPQLGTPHEVSTFFDTVLGDRLELSKLTRPIDSWITLSSSDKILNSFRPNIHIC